MKCSGGIETLNFRKCDYCECVIYMKSDINNISRFKRRYARAFSKWDRYSQTINSLALKTKDKRLHIVRNDPLTPDFMQRACFTRFSRIKYFKRNNLYLNVIWVDITQMTLDIVGPCASLTSSLSLNVLAEIYCLNNIQLIVFQLLKISVIGLYVQLYKSISAYF